MHEFSIVESLIDQVVAEVQAAGSDGCVKRVDLAVGCLSGVNVESLKFAYGVLAPGTLVDGAELSIRQPRATAHCRDCDARFDTEEYFADCVHCASGNVRIEGGRDLVLESIELEEED